MKQSTAIIHLCEMLFGLQKSRSIIREENPDLSKEWLEAIYPWVFGEKCPLNLLVKLLDSSETSKLHPIDYYNLMFILYRFIPSILVFSETLPSNPVDPTEYLRGWTPE